MLASSAKGFLGARGGAGDERHQRAFNVVGFGLNILNVREIRVGNLLPAIFYAIPPAVWLPIVIPN